MNEQPTPTFDDHILNLDEQANEALKTIEELKRQQKVALGPVIPWSGQALLFAAGSWAIMVISLCGSIPTFGLSLFLVLVAPIPAVIGLVQAGRVLTAKQVEGIGPYRNKALIALVMAFALLGILAIVLLIQVIMIITSIN